MLFKGIILKSFLKESCHPNMFLSMNPNMHTLDLLCAVFSYCAPDKPRGRQKVSVCSSALPFLAD